MIDDEKSASTQSAHESIKVSVNLRLAVDRQMADSPPLLSPFSSPHFFLPFQTSLSSFLASHIHSSAHPNELVSSLEIPCKTLEMLYCTCYQGGLGSGQWVRMMAVNIEGELNMYVVWHATRRSDET